MLTNRPTCIKVLITLVLLSFTVSAWTQSDFSSRTGRKYPEKSKIDLNKPVGPGTLEGRHADSRHNRTDNPGDKMTVHVDSMISFSDYEGYSIKEIYTYDCKGNLLSLLTRFLAGPNWEDYTIYRFTYDRKGNVLTETDQYWDGVTWTDYLVFTYTYDHHGNRITVLYNDIMGGFIELITSTYDNQGHRLSELGKYWDGTEWVNIEFYKYSYTSHGDLKKMVGQYWDGTSWVNSLRESWTYNKKHQLITDLVEESDGVDWSNYSLCISAYNSRGNLVSYLVNGWLNGTDWTMVSRGLYAYDSRDNRVTTLQQYYFNWETPPYWENTDSTHNYFNYQTKQVTGTGYVWDGIGWVPGETNIYIPFMDHGNQLVFADEYPAHRVEVWYSKAHREADTGENAPVAPYLAMTDISSELKISVNPNPVTDAFTIRVSTPTSEHFEFNLYDMQGRMIQKLFSGDLKAGEHQIGVRAIENEGKGLFFLKAVSPTTSQTVKLIKL